MRDSHAIPFQDSIAEGGIAHVCLVFIGYRASIAEIPPFCRRVSHLHFACSLRGKRSEKGEGVSHPIGHAETSKNPIARHRSEGPKGGRRKGGRGRKLSRFSFCCAFRCCVVYSPCFPVWGEEKVMTIYDAGPLAAGPLCGLLNRGVSPR